MAITPFTVPPAELRRRFAAGDYFNRALAGEFGCCLKDLGRSTSPDEPPGTLSLVVAYPNDALHRVFLVHIYLRPDGTLGASGQPDPKWLLEDGSIYIPESEGRVA
jgi:hypothetical protein